MVVGLAAPWQELKNRQPGLCTHGQEASDGTLIVGARLVDSVRPSPLSPLHSPPQAAVQDCRGGRDVEHPVLRRVNQVDHKTSQSDACQHPDEE